MKSGESRAITPFRWAPALVGLSGAAALAVAVQARTPVVDVVEDLLPPPHAVELMGPPKPEPLRIYGPPVPPEIVTKRSGPVASGTASGAAPGSLPGRIGPIGPGEGPLNAQVPAGGPIFGPTWDRKPLPRLPNSAQFVGPLASGTPARGLPAASVSPAAPTGPAAGGGSDAGSEIPDLTKVELSRVANPTVEVRDRASARVEATPERPVSLSVSLGESGPREAGDVVVVRLSANVDSYFIVMRVDPAGKATTVFQSSRPVQRLACVVKAGPEAGAEYLVAVASVRSLNSEDVTAALRGAGTGFTTMPAGAEAGSQPGQAWSTLLAHAGSVGGNTPAARWQRHEWSVATASFTTVARAEKPAGEAEVKAAGAATRAGSPAGPRPSTVAVKAPSAKAPVTKPPAGKPVAARKAVDPGEGSALPGKSGEKPAEPPQGESPDPGASALPGGE